uniref:AIPR family protein n=1 Tax=Prevotella sp. GTC17254 TaxID=3236794 RepID=A0AB33IT18_9BACT
MADLKNFVREIDEESMFYFDENNNSRPLAFAHSLIESLKERLSMDNYTIGYGAVKDMGGNVRGEIFGYALSSNGEVLTLIYSLYNDDAQNEIKTLHDADYQTAINRMQGFYQNCCSGTVSSILKQDDPLYPLADLLHEKGPEKKRGRPSLTPTPTHAIVTVRFLVFSNSFIRNDEIKKKRIKGRNLIPEVYDVSRLYQLFGSDVDHRVIDIEFGSEYNYKLPYIEMEVPQTGYKCFMTIFPGKLLQKLYEQYNTDLLLGNVRYFLGFKGSAKRNANVGIQETLRSQKQMFLAYNNGIVALAESLEIKSNEGSSDMDPEESANEVVTTGIIRAIKDFQIVNGGQTTASLFYAKEQKSSSPISLKGVFVPVKIIVLSNTDDKKEVSANITKSSNTQSPVKYADFSVSNPFNSRMEELSRDIRTNDGKKWYYERLRGQFEQDLKQQRKAEDQQLFKSMYDKKERLFKKELLAKVWKCMLNTPFDVVKGEGTNYDIFNRYVTENGIIPDEEYFKKSVALIILWNYIYNIPEVKKVGNCRAPVTAYTLSYLLNGSPRMFNLLKIWDSQSVDGVLSECIIKLSRTIMDTLNSIAEGLQKSVLSCSKTEGTYAEMKKRGVFCDYNSISEYFV